MSHHSSPSARVMRTSIAATAARAHSSSSCFVMAQLSIFFAPQGYSTGFKNHVPA